MIPRLSRLVVVSILIALTAVGCAGKKRPSITATPVPLRSAKDLYRRAMVLLSQRDLRQATAMLERIQYTSDDRTEIEPLVRLAVADATFWQANSIAWIEARGLYLEFVTLYGDHPLAPYAQMQAGLCSLKQKGGPSRDQFYALQAIDDLGEILRRYPGSPFATAARKQMRVARASLAEHEFLVGRFYMKRKSYLAAADRFRTILDSYPDYPEKEKVLYHLGRALLAVDNEVEGRIYLDKLVRDYPEGAYVEQARHELGRLSRGLDGGEGRLGE